MQVEVIEFELVCPEHGRNRMTVPAQCPWPSGCPHCYAPVTRREIRRFVDEMRVPDKVGSEAWIG